MFLIKKPFLIFCLFYPLMLSNITHGWAGLEAVVFDCGQGNTVAAKYNNTTMVFDAGRTGSAKFVAHEDDKSSESVLNKKYLISQKPDEALIRLNVPTERYVLEAISGNNKAYKEEFRNNLKDYLSTDKRTLNAVFISHPDADHYNLVVDSGLDPKVFVLGGKYPLYSQKFRDYVDDKTCIKDENYGDDDPLSRFTEHESFEQDCSFGEDDDDPKVEILTVNAKRTGAVADKNTDSMVVKISQTHSMIIPGDAEKETWDDAEEVSGLDALKTDVLLLSHHGSMTNGSTTPDLLNKIQPKACLISAGFQHDHPTAEIINILLEYYSNKNFRTSPHFVTFQEGKTRRCMMTNAPIFTTIDNGVLKVDLASAQLTVKCTRNFSPTPDVTLSDKEGTRLFFEEDENRTVLSLSQLKASRPANAVLFNDTAFGGTIFGIKDKNKKDLGNYYYQFGDAFLKMKLKEEISRLEDEDDDEDHITDVQTIKEWIEKQQQAQKKTYIHTLKLVEVRREL